MAAIFTIPYDLEAPGPGSVRGRPHTPRRRTTTITPAPSRDVEPLTGRLTGRLTSRLTRAEARRRRERLVPVLVAALLAVVAVFGLAVVFSLLDATSRPPADATVVAPVEARAATGAGEVLVVQQGDTLTSIARRLQPTGDPTALVDRLAAVHGPGILRAGERLPIGGLDVGG